MRFHLIFNSWSLWSRVCISYSTNYNAECHFYSQKQHHHHLWCQTTVKTAYNSSLIFIEFNRNSSTLKWRSPLWIKIECFLNCCSITFVTRSKKHWMNIGQNILFHKFFFIFLFENFVLLPPLLRRQIYPILNHFYCKKVQ